MSSNNYLQVRDYILTRMAVVEPSLVEWRDSLTDIGNIPKTLLNKTFHIAINSTASTPKTDLHIEDDVNVVVSIFRRAYQKEVETRDDLLQVANCIRLDVINFENIEAYKFANDGNIEDVVSVALTPTEIDVTNDNIIKIEIELNVRLFFGIT